MRSCLLTPLTAHHVIRPLTLIAGVFIFCACGSTSRSPKAAEVCRQGVKLLKQRVGPEFNKLISITPLPVAPPKKFGCAFTYTTIAEELPGEVSGEFISSIDGHELAFTLPDFEDRLILTQAPLPLHRRGQVEMLLKLAEIHGGDAPEIMVEERTIGSVEQIYSLRIFMYAEGVPAPKEIFSERMSVKLKSGIERPADLLIGEFEDRPTLFLKAQRAGRSKDRVFTWDESLQTYRYDLSATQRRALSGSASKQGLDLGQNRNPQNLNQRVKAGAKPSSLVGLLETDQGKASEVTTNSESPNTSPLDKDGVDSKVKDAVNQQTQESSPQANEPSPGKKEGNVTTVDEFLEGL